MSNENKFPSKQTTTFLLGLQYQFPSYTTGKPPPREIKCQRRRLSKPHSRAPAAPPRLSVAFARLVDLKAALPRHARCETNCQNSRYLYGRSLGRLLPLSSTTCSARTCQNVSEQHSSAGMGCIERRSRDGAARTRDVPSGELRVWDPGD